MHALATVITGAPKRRTPILVHFVTAELGFSHYCLVQYPGIEDVLGKDGQPLYTAQRRFLIRDLVESKASESRNSGSKACVLVGNVLHMPDTPEYRDCERAMLQERDEIEKIVHFDEFFVACLTPDMSILPVIC